MVQETEKKQNSENTKTSTDSAVKESAVNNSARAQQGRRDGGFQGQGRRGNSRRENRKPRMEFEQKIVSIRRVTRVVAGGRRFSFSVSLVIGDKKGSVGVGMGKATDTALAIEKAYNDAKRSMIKVALDDSMSIPHSVSTKFTSSEVFIKPAPGKGIIAGSSVRTVLELAGITNVNAKVFSRSKNAFNNAKAAIQALSQVKHPEPSVK